MSGPTLCPRCGGLLGSLSIVQGIEHVRGCTVPVPSATDQVVGSYLDLVQADIERELDDDAALERQAGREGGTP